MLNDAVQVRAVHRVLCEHAGNELFGREREGGREGVPGLSDTVVRLLQVRGLEWRFSQEHGVPEKENECKINKGLALKIIVQSTFTYVYSVNRF